MNDIIHLILTLVCCYLLGSILFGLILAESAYGVDIRQLGSGNVGFTNIKRVLGWKPAILVLVLDALKGMLAVMLSRHVFTPGDYGGLSATLVVLGGVLSIIGHNWSAFSKFEGGKGVATSLGVLIALDWRAAVIALVIGFPLLVYPGYMSLASMVGTATVPISFWILKDPVPYGVFGVIVLIFVLIRHRENIDRLRKGTESRFSFGSRTAAPPKPPGGSLNEEGT